MKMVIPILSLLFGVLTMANCHREHIPAQTQEPDLIETDTVSKGHTWDRNDVPPPPTEDWRTIDTTQFSECEQQLWAYFRLFYPIYEENPIGVPIYGIALQGKDLIERGEHEGEIFQFFAYGMQKLLNRLPDPPCLGQIDSTYFLGLLGPPTHISINENKKLIHYFYSIKKRDRMGPCPYPFHGPPYNPHNTQYYHYCGVLKATFGMDNGFLAQTFYGG